jgi:hypothetical protein
MPAIQPARLKIQVQEMSQLVDDPAAFLRALHDLLDFYADRTRRFQRGDRAMSLIRNYRVPDQVLRQIEIGLIPVLSPHPDTAIALADSLWEDGWLETRLLAITIVGQIKPQPPERVSEKVRAWGLMSKDPMVTKALAFRGTERLRQGQRDHFLEMVEEWLSSGELSLVRVGLHAVAHLLEDQRFENLALIFRWLSPLTRQVDFKTKQALIPVLKLLAQRSPQETAYFLRKILTSTENVHIPGLIRKLLDQFPEHLQDSLRQHLRKNRDL